MLIAAEFDHVEVLGYLLKNGANVDAKKYIRRDRVAFGRYVRLSQIGLAVARTKSRP